MANETVQELACDSGRGHVVPVNLSPESVRAQLEKILTSPCFVRAKSSSRLLRFVVEQSLFSDAGQIKEYLLGVEVLGRKGSFDPQLDPIVRVEACRLRKKLHEYYQAVGRDDSILIELPKGHYVPIFRKRQPSASPTGASVRCWRVPWKRVALPIGAFVLVSVATLWRHCVPGQKLVVSKLHGTTAPARNGYVGLGASTEPTRASIAVLPFANLSRDKDLEYFSEGLTEELIVGLARMPGLHVVSRTSALHFKGRPDDIRSIGKRLNVGMVLEGSVRRAGNQVRITIQLVNTVDGYHLWAETYDGEVKDVLSFQRGFAKAIVGALGVELAKASGAPHFERYSTSR